MWYRPDGPYIWRPELTLRRAEYRSSQGIAEYQSWWPTANWRIKTRWRVHALWAALWLTPSAAAYLQSNRRIDQEQAAFLRDGTVLRLPGGNYELEVRGFVHHYHDLQHRGQMLWATDTGLDADLDA
jgi:hypothetical protein